MKRSVRAQALCIVLIALGPMAPAGAQAPVAHPTPGAMSSPVGSLPVEPFTDCPVPLKTVTTIAGRAMRPDPMYLSPAGSLSVEKVSRIPGGDPETTVYTCAYLSATGAPPDRVLFIRFSVGDSASWLWEINGPSIKDGGMYHAITDGDPSTVDVYETTHLFAADGGAFPLPVWEADRYYQSDQLFAHIIVDAAGEHVREVQVELAASIAFLFLQAALR